MRASSSRPNSRARRLGAGRAAGPPTVSASSSPDAPDVHRAEDAGRLPSSSGCSVRSRSGDGLPVAREPPLERRPLIHQLHGGQHNDPVTRVEGEPHAPTTLVVEPSEALMATEVKLPRLGQGMESGVIVRWLKAEGDAVAKGEPLYELDTDKVTQEVEAELDGVLTKIVVAEGEVEVGATVAVIEADGAAEAPAESPRRARRARPRRAADAAPLPSQPPRRSRSPRRRAGGRRPPRRPTAARAAPGERRVKASPLARRIARERGVDLASSRERARTGGSSPRTSSRPPQASQPHPRPPPPRRRLPPGEVEVVQLTLDPQDDRAAAHRGLDGARSSSSASPPT